MKQTFAIAALAGIAMAKNLIGDASFIQFQSTNSKSYKSVAEYKLRQQIYQKNDEIINSKNSEADQNDPDALVLAHNWTSDLTQEEYLGLLGLNQEDADANAIDGLEMGEETSTLSTGRSLNGTHDMLGKAHRATDVDWAYDGKMVGVKDQGSCGSCWAFAATTALEGTIAIKTDKAPVHLSEQQIVDCTLTTNPDNEKEFGKDYRAYGCQGGWMSYAWDFMHDQGAMTDTDYPYTSGKTKKEGECAHKKDKTVSKVKQYGQIDSTVADVKAKLKEQPLAVAVDAGEAAFQFYSSGVVKKADECGTRLNHAVTLVGYTDKDENKPDPDPQPSGEFKVTKWWHNEGSKVNRVHADEKNLSNYWKVQNSWSSSWGDQGFIRIEITDGEGVCGINKNIEWVDFVQPNSDEEGEHDDEMACGPM